MKIKAFSLLELIIVIFIITMILYFIIPKFQNIFYKSHLTQLKSNVAMIRSNISSLKNKEILYLKDLEIKDLDKATADKKNEKLFTKIIDFDIISTDTQTQELGKWIKLSTSSYEYVLTSEKSVLFAITNDTFLCKSKIEICKEVE